MQCKADKAPGIFDSALSQASLPQASQGLCDAAPHLQAEKGINALLIPAGSSFGIDLVSVILAPDLRGRPLVIELSGSAGGQAEFVVQVLYLEDAHDGSAPRLVATQSVPPAMQTAANPVGHAFIVIPHLDTAHYDVLGLVITRGDANEHLDPSGAFTVTLHEPEGMR